MIIVLIVSVFLAVIYIPLLYFASIYPIIVILFTHKKIIIHDDKMELITYAGIKDATIFFKDVEKIDLDDDRVSPYKFGTGVQKEDAVTFYKAKGKTKLCKAYLDDDKWKEIYEIVQNHNKIR